eukprot:6214749-Pleurochrysis_carterae.AAC.7
MWLSSALSLAAPCCPASWRSAALAAILSVSLCPSSRKAAKLAKPLAIEYVTTRGHPLLVTTRPSMELKPGRTLFSSA